LDALKISRLLGCDVKDVEEVKFKMQEAVGRCKVEGVVCGCFFKPVPRWLVYEKKVKNKKKKVKKELTLLQKLSIISYGHIPTNLFSKKILSMDNDGEVWWVVNLSSGVSFVSKNYVPVGSYVVVDVQNFNIPVGGRSHKIVRCNYAKGVKIVGEDVKNIDYEEAVKYVSPICGTPLYTKELFVYSLLSYDASGLRKPVPILICGPSGTGKTTFLVGIHESMGFPLLHSDDLSKTLFGYVKDGEAVTPITHYCVLVDEVDKASPDMINLILEVASGDYMERFKWGKHIRPPFRGYLFFGTLMRDVSFWNEVKKKAFAQLLRRCVLVNIQLDADRYFEEVSSKGIVGNREHFYALLRRRSVDVVFDNKVSNDFIMKWFRDVNLDKYSELDYEVHYDKIMVNHVKNLAIGRAKAFGKKKVSVSDVEYVCKVLYKHLYSLGIVEISTTTRSEIQEYLSSIKGRTINLETCCSRFCMCEEAVRDVMDDFSRGGIVKLVDSDKWKVIGASDSDLYDVILDKKEEEAIINALQLSEPLTIDDICVMTGIDKGKVEKFVKKLFGMGKLRKLGDKYTWVPYV